MRILGLVLFAAIAGVMGACRHAPPPEHAAGEAWIRVDNVGYLPKDPKIAILAADEPVSGTFSVGSFTADIGRDEGAFGPFAHHYRLDFTRLDAPGRHSVRCGRWSSPEFAIGPDVHRDLEAALLSFVRLQRCGANPVTGRTCHAADGFDALTGRILDLRGGWHDAGDRIKHVITTSWCVAALQLAGAREEAGYGAEFLRRLHPDPETLFVQVGDDRDHTGGWTLWYDDRVDYGRGPGGARAAWPATGAPGGPKFRNASTGVASLAARCAAALALAGDVQTARSLHRLALAKPGCAHSVPVRAPHHYGERTWEDDMEWAAVELFRATGERPFLDEALRWARLAHDSSFMGRERHGHYEWFPYINLAHWRLHEVADAEMRSLIEGWYRSGLEEVRLRAERNPWRHGTPLVWCSTNDAIAFALQAALYERMTGDRAFRVLGTEARDWVLGRNPWGVSFVTGVPAGAGSAFRVHHPFAKLGSIPPRGGLVDGPVSPDIHRGLPIPPTVPDPFLRFQSDWAVWHDDLQDFATNEPILDGSVSLLLLLRCLPTN